MNTTTTERMVTNLGQFDAQGPKTLMAAVTPLYRQWALWERYDAPPSIRLTMDRAGNVWAISRVVRV